MSAGVANLGASVCARLLNHAKRTGVDYQTLLTSYCIERFPAPEIPVDDPIGLTRAYWENPSRPAQVRAFARRSGLAVSEGSGEELARTLGAFLSPLLAALRKGTPREGLWPPGGPWIPT